MEPMGPMDEEGGGPAAGARREPCRPGFHGEGGYIGQCVAHGPAWDCRMGLHGAAACSACSRPTQVLNADCPCPCRSLCM
jgi:hypothetical protein